MHFKVKAVHIDGTPYEDTVEAESAPAVGARLRADGFSVTSIEYERPKPARRFFGASRAEDLASACQQLSVFLGSGATLPSALRAVARDMGSAGFRAALEEAAWKVDSGAALHDALAAQPRHFPPLFRFIVETGCAAGQLGAALLLLADYYETTARLRRRFVEAAIYPVLLVVAMVALVVFAAYFVIPRFVVTYAAYDTPLPAPTRVALYLVQSSGEWLPWFVAGVAGAAIALLAASRSRTFQYAAGRAVFSIPFFGGMMRAYVVARISAGLTLLLQSQVAAPQALQLLADVEPNLWVRGVTAELARQTEGGASVSEALLRAPSALLPKTFLWVLSSADGTAALAEASGRLGQLYADIARQRFRMIEVMLVPVMVFIMGGLTLLVAAILLLPLLQALYML